MEAARRRCASVPLWIRVQRTQLQQQQQQQCSSHAAPVQQPCSSRPLAVQQPPPPVVWSYGPFTNELQSNLARWSRNHCIRNVWRPRGRQTIVYVTFGSLRQPGGPAWPPLGGGLRAARPDFGDNSWGGAAGRREAYHIYIYIYRYVYVCICIRMRFCLNHFHAYAYVYGNHMDHE